MLCFICNEVQKVTRSTFSNYNTEKEHENPNNSPQKLKIRKIICEVLNIKNKFVRDRFYENDKLPFCSTCVVEVAQIVELKEKINSFEKEIRSKIKTIHSIVLSSYSSRDSSRIYKDYFKDDYSETQDANLILNDVHKLRNKFREAILIEAKNRELLEIKLEKLKYKDSSAKVTDISLHQLNIHTDDSISEKNLKESSNTLKNKTSQAQNTSDSNSKNENVVSKPKSSPEKKILIYNKSVPSDSRVVIISEKSKNESNKKVSLNLTKENQKALKPDLAHKNSDKILILVPRVFKEATSPVKTNKDETINRSTLNLDNKTNVNATNLTLTSSSASTADKRIDEVNDNVVDSNAISDFDESFLDNCYESDSDLDYQSLRKDDHHIRETSQRTSDYIFRYVDSELVLEKNFQSPSSYIEENVSDGKFIRIRTLKDGYPRILWTKNVDLGEKDENGYLLGSCKFPSCSYSATRVLGDKEKENVIKMLQIHIFESHLIKEEEVKKRKVVLPPPVIDESRVTPIGYIPEGVLITPDNKLMFQDHEIIVINKDPNDIMLECATCHASFNANKIIMRKVSKSKKNPYKILMDHIAKYHPRKKSGLKLAKDQSQIVWKLIDGKMMRVSMLDLLLLKEVQEQEQDHNSEINQF